MSSERDTGGTGALDTHSIKLAATAQPLQQGGIAGRRCRELAIVELTADAIDHRGMVAVPMGVHAADDTNRRRCHARHGLPLLFAPVR
jgi:hypothetical protein